MLSLLLLAGACIAQAQPIPDDERTAKLYDIGDLIAEVAKMAPDVELGARADAKPRPAAGKGADSIVRLLQAFVKPPLAGDEEIQAIGERWVVALARMEQHAWIERFLQAARGKQDESNLIEIECQWFSLPEFTFLRDIHPVFDEVDEKAKRNAGKKVESVSSNDTSYLTEIIAPGAMTNAFMRALKMNKDVTGIVAPKLLVEPLNIANVSVLNQTAYVRDFNIEVGKNAFLADPIVDVIQDGIVLQTAVTPLENGLLGLSVDAQVAELKRPIETHEVSLGVGQKVTVQLPHLQSTKIESAVELAPGHMVLLAPPPLAGKRMLFFIKVSPLEKIEPQVRRKRY